MNETSILDLLIERPVAGGRMLARHEGRVVLVSGTLPGERVRARVTRVSGHVTFADASEVIEASADRRVPPCDPACGGSAYAHIAYPRQLELKRDVIADAFRRIGKHAAAPAATMAGSVETGYRMRARLHIRRRRAGFFREGTHELCDAAPTGQLRPDTIAVVQSVLEAIADRLAEVEALVVAENLPATDRVVHLEPKPGARFDDLRGKVALPAGLSGLTAPIGGRAVALAGSAIVTDDLLPLLDTAGFDASIEQLTLTRHATSFFQANRHLLGDLLRRVIAAATGERVVDLYAGVGLFAVAIAARGARVLAVEGDRSSGADLSVNARPWRERLQLVRGAVEDAVATHLDPPPDVIVLDPPRTGVSPAALTGVIAWRTPLVVYVSCDPPTLARDAGRLIAAGYTLERLDGFDLFPNTAHVETVAVFRRAV